MPRPRRVARPDPDQLQPLYPTARLLKGAVFEADQLRREAAMLRREAADLRDQAATVRQQAEQDAKSLRAVAIDEGRREGARQLAQLLENTVAQADRQSETFAKQVAEVSLRIARAVLDIQFSVQPQRIADLVTESLERLRGRFPQRVAVHLHPDDHALLLGRESGFSSLLADDTLLRLVADDAVPPHGVYLVTELGRIDASIEQQLSDLAIRLQNA